MTLTFLFALSAVLNDKLTFYQNTRCRHVVEIWFDLDNMEVGRGGEHFVVTSYNVDFYSIIIFYLQNPHFQKKYTLRSLPWFQKKLLEKGLRPQVLAINVSKFLPASRCSKRQLGSRSWNFVIWATFNIHVSFSFLCKFLRHPWPVRQIPQYWAPPSWVAQGKGWTRDLTEIKQSVN